MAIHKTYFIEHFHIQDDGVFPNSALPVILYRGVLRLPVVFTAASVSRLFKKNHWENSWKSGIFEYHHYHSITHEVVGICKGETTLQMGGEKGMKITVRKGDVLIIPAGVAHKNLGAENAILCVGAYPDGANYDMNYGKPAERPKADRNIHRVTLPSADPVLGTQGGIVHFWK